MQDMLVRLYDLPDFSVLEGALHDKNVSIRPALAAEKSIVVDWVSERFGKGWASETEVCFSYQPITCLIALKGTDIIGFACYDAAYRNFFWTYGESLSQSGVKESVRYCFGGASSV